MVFGWGNGIVAAFGQGMAAEETPQGQGECDGEGVCAKALKGILRTGGLVPTWAGRYGEKAHQGRQQILVDPDQKPGHDAKCVVNFGEGIDHCFFWGILIKIRQHIDKI